MADTFVLITHPEVEGSAKVTERYYLRSLREKGWRLADEQPTHPAEPSPEVRRPQKNDSTDSWRAYASAQGMPADQAAAMSRDEIVAHYSALEA